MFSLFNPIFSLLVFIRFSVSLMIFSFNIMNLGFDHTSSRWSHLNRFYFSFSIQNFFREYLYFIHSLTEDATFLVWPYLKGPLIDYWHGTGSRLCFLTPQPQQAIKMMVINLVINKWISLKQPGIWCLLAYLSGFMLFTVFLTSENFS